MKLWVRLFSGLSLFGLVLLITGCPASRNHEINRYIRGWWVAVEITPHGGSPIKVDKEGTSLLIGFNDDFQAYTLDGTVENCQGTHHRFQVRDLNIVLEPVGDCRPKIGSPSFEKADELILNHVTLAESQYFDQIVLRRIAAKNARTLYSSVFLPQYENHKKQKEAEKTSEEKMSSRKVIDDTTLQSDLEGYWKREYLIYDGKLVLPGEQFEYKGPPSGIRIKLTQGKMILHLKKGKARVYGDKAATSSDYVDYSVKDSTILVGSKPSGFVFQIRSFAPQEFRTDGEGHGFPFSLSEKDGVIFRKLSREAALKAVPEN